MNTYLNIFYYCDIFSMIFFFFFVFYSFQILNPVRFTTNLVFINFKCLYVWWILWHINLYRLFNAKSISM